ncbi:MAG: DegV family protein [Anaerolineales bacterium]|nr:DegV family protein [Anaerolineales bacterium]
MLDITLLMDSTTVIPKKLIEEYGVTVIPVPIHAGGKEYRDGVDITPEELYVLLETAKDRPSTAVPGLGEFLSFYNDLLETYQKIVYLAPSSRLTGVFNAAVQSAKQVEDARIVAVDPPEELGDELYTVHSDDPLLENKLAEIGRLTAPVIVVMNTDFVSGAAGLIAIEAIKAINEGRSIDEVVGKIIDAKRKTGIYLILNTFEYIVDRVGELQAFLGTLLKIKPVLTLRDGYLEDVARVRGERKARRRMIELVKERVGDERIDVYVLHSLAREKAVDFLEQIRGELNVGNSYIDDIGSSVSRYIGRGGLAIVYMSVE